MTELETSIEDTLQEMGFSMVAVFIPQKLKSLRDNPQLRWQVVLSFGASEVLSFPYSAGMGYCPSYKPNQRLTIEYADKVRSELETGRAFRPYGLGKPIMPKLCNVVWCLLMDAMGADESFEDWAANLGYSDDSIKAQETYNECRKVAKALNKLGKADLDKLAELFQNY